MLEKAGGNKPREQSRHLQESKELLGFWFSSSPPVATQKQRQDRDLGMLGGPLSIPHPSRQSEPGQTKMKQRCVLQNTVQHYRGRPTQAGGPSLPLPWRKAKQRSPWW